jgi:hypothetical protein
MEAPLRVLAVEQAAHFDPDIQTVARSRAIGAVHVP